MYNLDLLNNVGDDVFLSKNCEIRRPHLVNIGNHVAIDSGFYCTVGANLGDHIHIGPYVTAIGGEEGRLTLEHFSTVAAGTRIICGSDNHLGDGLVGPTAPDEWRDSVTVAPVTFKMFASAGTNAVILPGVTLAEGSVIGACSMLTECTEPWTIYAGTPAKPIKSRPKERMIEAGKALGYL